MTRMTDADAPVHPGDGLSLTSVACTGPPSRVSPNRCWVAGRGSSTSRSIPSPRPRRCASTPARPRWHSCAPGSRTGSTWARSPRMARALSSSRWTARQRVSSASPTSSSCGTDPLDVAVALRIAAGVFVPAFGLVLRPEIAAPTMAGSSFIVAVNALALKRLRLPDAATSPEPQSTTATRETTPERLSV